MFMGAHLTEVGSKQMGKSKLKPGRNQNLNQSRSPKKARQVLADLGWGAKKLKYVHKFPIGGQN